jgi:hypothetical protein
MHEVRIIEEIEHQAIDASQVGTLGARTFHPTHERFFVTHPLLHQLERPDGGVHPSTTQRIGETQGVQPALVGQQSFLFINRRRLIVEKLDPRAAIAGLSLPADCEFAASCWTWRRTPAT